MAVVPLPQLPGDLQAGAFRVSIGAANCRQGLLLYIGQFRRDATGMNFFVKGGIRGQEDMGGSVVAIETVHHVLCGSLCCRNPLLVVDRAGAVRFFELHPDDLLLFGVSCLVVELVLFGDVPMDTMGAWPW